MGTTEPVALGTAKTADAPCFHNGMIWYREDGTNRLMVMPMDDPSKAFNPGGLKTLSEPVLVQNRYMTFRGEDDRVMLVTVDAPYLHGQLADHRCLSAPAVDRGYFFFQGRGNTLNRCRLDRHEHAIQTSGGQPIENCVQRPAVSVRLHRVCYRGAFPHQLDTLYHVNIVDGSGVTYPMTHTSPTAFYTASNGIIWLVDAAKLKFISEEPALTNGLRTFIHADPIRPCAMAQPTDDYIYFVYYGDLYRAPVRRNITDRNRELIAKGCATPPDVQHGFVLYGGTDKKLYKVALGGAQS